MRRLAGMMDLGNWLTLEMRRRSAWTIGRRSKSSSPWRIDLRVSDIPYHRPGSVAIRILPVRVGMAILMALLDCLRRRRTLDVEGLLAKIGEVVVYLGGGGVVVLGLSGWIGKIFSNRFVEKLKQKSNTKWRVTEQSSRNRSSFFRRNLRRHRTSSLCAGVFCPITYIRIWSGLRCASMLL